jgi:hypothetical protein
MMTLTLKLTVTYEPNGVPVEELRSMAEEIANHAANRGMTCDTLAEVEDWHAVVVEENDRRHKSTNTA